MKRQVVSNFVLGFLTATAILAHAEPSRGIASLHDDHFFYPDRSSFQAVSQGRSLSQRDIIFRSILSTEGKDLAWPGFPRTWHEQSTSEYLTANTAVGLNVGGNGGAINLDYKYTLKSSLVIIASNRMEEADVDNNGVTVEPVGDPLEFEVFRWDAASHRTLPNVRKGYPMVAFCAYEAALTYGTSLKGGLQFMGSGQTIETGKVRSITHTLFSRFFQVDGTQSPIELLEGICADGFRKQVQDYVNRDFSHAVIEATAYVHPDNECKPDAKNDSPAGDAECMTWHQNNFDKSMRAITIPRCVFDSRGIHRCQVTSKENGNCSMYWDSSARKSITAQEIVAGKRYSKSTDAPYEFPCDPSAGLTCTMVKQPWILLNVPAWQGTARCVRK